MIITAAPESGRFMLWNKADHNVEKGPRMGPFSLVSLEEAMDALDFSEEEKSGYKKWIADNKQS